MKKVLFMLAAIVLAITQLNAQTSLIATLSHEGNISAYYGANALIQAYEAAEDGDVITLSAGIFNSVNIAKAIILRGSGCEIDQATGRLATYITGDFTLTKPESTDDPIVIEGIFHNSTLKTDGIGLKAQIIKSRLDRIDVGYGKNTQFTILNCRITNGFYLNNESNALCINSIICNPSGSNGTFDFRNCYISTDYNLQNSLLNNCFILGTSYGCGLNSSCIANYCVGSGNSGILSQASGSNNTYIEDFSTLFESYSEKMEDTTTYVLTEEAKTQYIGGDGTEIGIYGGMLPYSTTPSTPQITKFKVAEKSTLDGKLSIDITISMPE